MDKLGYRRSDEELSIRIRGRAAILVGSAAVHTQAHSTKYITTALTSPDYLYAYKTL